MIWRDSETGKQSSRTFGADDNREGTLLWDFMDANNQSLQLAEEGVIEMRSDAKSVAEHIGHLTGIDSDTRAITYRTPARDHSCSMAVGTIKRRPTVREVVNNTSLFRPLHQGASRYIAKATRRVRNGRSTPRTRNSGGSMSNQVLPAEVVGVTKAVFTDHPDGRELRLRDVAAENGNVLVYFDGRANDHDGPFAAKIPHPQEICDEIWRMHDDTDSLSEWCTYAVLVPILEEYLTGRAEGRGTRDGEYWWLDLSD